MSLKTEITDDPLARGYSGMSDEELADSLNTADRPRNRTSMSRSEILQAVVPAAYNALTGDDLVAFWGLLSVENINPFGVEAEVMKQIFGTSSATVIALASARIETISRAQELEFGEVKAGHVQFERR